MKSTKFELTVEQLEMLFGEKLNSSVFTWSRYCGKRYLSVLTIFDNYDSDGIFSRRFKCEGWCDANKIPCNSKESGFVVMLWDTKEKHKVWCHISIDLSTTIFRRYELNKMK